LYVEYKFLDLPLEETETFSLPKPQNHEEGITFGVRLNGFFKFLCPFKPVVLKSEPDPSLPNQLAAPSI